MSESGAAVLAGEGSAAPGADEGTPAPGDGGQDLSNGVDKPNGAGDGAAPDAPWYGTDLDEDTTAFMKVKGWDGIGKMIESYRHLERKVGKDTVAPPGEGAGEEEWEQFYTALGRPEQADQYELTAPEGQDEVDPQMAGFIRNASHKAGLSQKQVGVMNAAWNDFMAEVTTAQETEFQTQATADMQALGREWGNAYDGNVNAGKQAVAALGLTPDDLNGMERALGTKKMMTMLTAMGKQVAEAGAKGGKPGGGADSEADYNALSPADAKARYDELMSDTEFRKRYMNGDAPTVAKVTALRKAMTAKPKEEL